MKALKVVLFAVMLAAMPLLALSTSASAQADTVVLNLRIPYTATYNVPCADGGSGEDVTFTGSLHVLMADTYRDSVLVRSTIHWQAQAMTGIGQTTGDRYQVKGVTHISIVERPAGGSVYQQTDNLRMIGQGPGVNYLLHFTTSIQIDADGNVTVRISGWIECK
jgi:hypothetical protein